MYDHSSNSFTLDENDSLAESSEYVIESNETSHSHYEEINNFISQTMVESKTDEFSKTYHYLEEYQPFQEPNINFLPPSGIDEAKKIEYDVNDEFILTLAIKNSFPLLIGKCFPVIMPIVRSTVKLIKENYEGCIFVQNSTYSDFYACFIKAIGLNRTNLKMLVILECKKSFTVDNIEYMSNILWDGNISIEIVLKQCLLKNYQSQDYHNINDIINSIEKYCDKLPENHENQLKLNEEFMKERLLDVICHNFHFLPNYYFLKKIHLKNLVNSFKNSMFLADSSITSSIYGTNVSNIIDRIKSVKDKNYCCPSCSYILMPYEYLKSFKEETLDCIQYHCNPNHYTFPLIAFHFDLLHPERYDIVRTTDSYIDFCWFKGFSWTSIYCRNCDHHIGWLFEPLVHHFSGPDPFIGVNID